MDTLGFWNSFLGEAIELASMFHSGRHQEVFSSLEKMLANQGIEYCFDMSADDQWCFLVFSPEGDESLAEEIDSFLSRAPSIPKWKIFGRRQPKELGDVRAILQDLYLTDIFQCHFRCDWATKPFFVEILVPPSTDLTAEEKRGFANTFLWHTLGEDLVIRQGIKAGVKTRNSQNPGISAQDFISEANITLAGFR